jgi:hypothetical protein
MTTSVLIPEFQIHQDQHFGYKVTETYRRIKVHTNQAPDILDVTRNLSREESQYLKYSREIIRLNPNEVKPMQTRTVNLDLLNVDQILQFLNKEGYDPTELPPAIVRFHGEYYLINGHHQVAALKERNQTLWIFDVYQGPDDVNIFESSVKGLGKRINLSGTVPKKDQQPIDIRNSYVREIKENYDRTGIGGLRYDENRTIIPLTQKCVEFVLDRDGFTSRWGPDMSSGLKSVYTKTLKHILAWESQTTISNIRSLDDNRRKRILKGGKFADNGKSTVDGYKGYIVCTDYPNSDGPKALIQIISSDKPVRFLSFSKETDDPNNIIENEKTYLKKAYDTYVQVTKFHNSLITKNEEQRLHDKLSIKSYTYEQFLSMFEWWAVSQLDGENGEVIQRA